MIKRQMRVMDFITRERVYRFLEEYSKSTLAKFLRSYFPKEVVDSLLASFEVRIDTRCCYKGDYAAILVFMHLSNIPKNRTPMWNTNLFRMVTSIVLSQKN